MITKKEANRLRGLVARHARCQWNMGAAAGSRGDVKQRRRIVDDARKASNALYDEILKLTELFSK